MSSWLYLSRPILTGRLLRADPDGEGQGQQRGRRDQTRLLKHVQSPSNSTASALVATGRRVTSAFYALRAASCAPIDGGALSLFHRDLL